MALSTRDVSYPEDGVKLGQGWDSISGQKKDIIGVSFVEAKDSGQESQYRIAHATERNKLMKELEVSVEVQYKYLAYSVGAKAKFSDTVSISGTFDSFTTWANVKNGVIYAAPVDRDQSERIASLLVYGKTSAEVIKILEINQAEHSKKYPLKHLHESKEDAIKRSETGIWLTDNALGLARTNREQFREKYGDCFVAAIYGGAELDVAMTFNTSSRDEQEKIAASMNGSGWGLDIKGEAVQTMKTYSEQSKLTIMYHQSGGSGGVMPTDLDGFLKQIQKLPEIAAGAPYYFKITLKRYDSLPNWPGDQFDVLVPAYEQIMRRYYEYRDLFDEIEYIKQNSDRYILNTNKTFDYPGTTLQALEEVQDELHKGIADLLTLLNQNKGNEDCAVYEMPQSASKPDYEFRIAMPLPLDFISNDSKVAFTVDDYKKIICDKWIRPISSIRCEMYSAADPGCLTNAKIHELESNVYYLAIVGGKIEIPGQAPSIWGETNDIKKAQEVLIVADQLTQADKPVKSSFYLRAMPFSYSIIAGIEDTCTGYGLVWGNATDKKVIAILWANGIKYNFYLRSPCMGTSGERIVGGQKRGDNVWGFETNVRVLYNSDDGGGFYMSS